MDISSIVGVISGIGFVLGTILLNSSLMTFVNIPSIFIVIGGTLAAGMISYPFQDFISVFKTSTKIFFFSIEDPEDIIANLLELSNKARKGGLLSIENDIHATNNPYLAQALQMTVDGIKTSDIAVIMKKQMDLVKKKLDIGADVLDKMGTYAPAFGMIGTLIGLVQMLASLSDPTTIGPRMAVALITTFYGAVAANLFLIPMAKKLKSRNEEEIVNMHIVFEGIVSIREGEHPKLMEDKLNIYLSN